MLLAATAVSDKLTDGWTKYGDTCEYKVDSDGAVTLRPLGGGSYAELTSLSGWSTLDPTSFKIEGTIKLISDSRFESQDLLGLYGAFRWCDELAFVDLSGLISDEAVSCDQTFAGCSSLASVKLPESLKVSCAGCMFDGCSALKSVNLTGLETLKAVSCERMFSYCLSLTSVTLQSPFKAYNTISMFYNCAALTQLDLSGLDTSEAGLMRDMFESCCNLTTVTLGENFSFCGSGTERLCNLSAGSFFQTSYWVSSADRSKVYSGYQVPNNVASTYSSSASDGWTKCDSCEWKIDSDGAMILRPLGGASYAELSFPSLYSLEPTSFKVEGAVGGSDLNSMFEWCSKLASVDLSGLETSWSVNCYYMFKGCSSLTSVTWPESGLAVSNADSMFSGCTKLRKMDLSSLDFSELTNAASMFDNCEKLQSVDLSSFTPSAAISAASMFYGCDLLSKITAPKDAKVSLTNASQMFYQCGSLTSLDVSWLDTSQATSFSSMFYGCSKLASLDVTGFDTSSATTMYSMFDDCSALKSLDLSGFDTSNVKSMDYMFSGCSLLESLDLSAFDTSEVTSMNGMFQSCKSLDYLDLSGFDTSNANHMDYLFGGSFPSTIKLGRKFTFNGAYSERQTNLPGENDVYVRGYPVVYTGKWVSSVDGKVYSADAIPNNVAATYTAQKKSDLVTMYRLYNPYTGEHLYTSSEGERDNLRNVGWNYEGEAWTAPAKSKTQVYRLYNPYAAGGDHHYTTKKDEVEMLKAAGWSYEGVAWYSADEKGGVPLYRQYNPYAATGTHNYTTSKAENDSLVSAGWREEGVGWYGVK